MYKTDILPRVCQACYYHKLVISRNPGTFITTTHTLKDTEKGKVLPNRKNNLGYKGLSRLLYVTRFTANDGSGYTPVRIIACQGHIPRTHVKDKLIDICPYVLLLELSRMDKHLSYVLVWYIGWYVYFLFTSCLGFWYTLLLNRNTIDLTNGLEKSGQD